MCGDVIRYAALNGSNPYVKVEWYAFMRSVRVNGELFENFPWRWALCGNTNWVNWFYKSLGGAVVHPRAEVMQG